MFGITVSISGDIALVGTWDNTGTGLGTAYVYTGFSIIPLTLTVTLSTSSGDGTFTYDLEFTNNTADPLTIDIWTEITDPHGDRKAGKILSKRTLQGHRSYSKSGTSTIKETAPLGEYFFAVYAGIFPDSVIASAGATYLKKSFDSQKSLISEETTYTTGLLDNFPDPFNPSTTIRYDLSYEAHVTITIYNMLGQLVKTLVDESQSIGEKSVVWDGRNEAGAAVSSGIYIYRMRAGSFVETKRMMLVK